MANSLKHESTFSGELYNLSFDSVEEDSDVAWFSLIQNLSHSKLQTLKAIFEEKRDSRLDREEFLNAICFLYGNSKYSLQSTLLFDDIVKGEKTAIAWNDLLDFLIENISPKINQKVLLTLIKIDSIPHTKRETVVKIVSIETEKYFCYAILAKHGRVGLYDGNLNFLTSYHAIMTREDISRSEFERRRRNRWITDALFCEDVMMFIVTNTARSIMIYEASGLKHVPYWLVLSTPNIIECFTYKCYDRFTNSPSESILFTGDTYGEVTSFTFLQPKAGLLRRKYNDKISLFYWNELPNEKEYVLVKPHGKIHRNCIRKIMYNPCNNTVFTCSRDFDMSVVQSSVLNKKKSYVFKLRRGASSFILNSKLKLLITGSDDGSIRLWNPVVVSKPVAVLLGHRNDILDLKIMENQRLLLSCSRDGVLKLWDITEQKCIQTIKIKFPCFDVEGKCIEWGRECIFPGPRRYSSEENIDEDDTKKCFNIDNIAERKQTGESQLKSSILDSWETSNILVTCCNYIANITLTFDDIDIEKSFQMQVLPPPPLQTSVLIPSSWRIQIKTDETEMGEPQVGDIDIKASMEKLSFILNKDLLEDDSMKCDINYKIAILEIKKAQMQKHVARGAPYIALDIFETEELKLSEDLPAPAKKSIKSLVEKTEKLLADASTKDQMFSEASSSKSKSSKSSLIEFPY